MSKPSCLAAALMLAAALPARGEGLPTCDEGERRLPMVAPAEADDHRLSPRPLVSYPAGTALDAVDDHLFVTIRVDEAGKPTCVAEDDLLMERPALAGKLLALAPSWRFRPFERDGKAVPVRVRQWVDFQILPGRVAEVPPVRAEDSSVTLVVVRCFWGCPEYALTVRGDGWVGYRGTGRVAVEGSRTWRIPASEVGPLLELARNPGLWAAEDAYDLDMHHGGTFLIRVDAGSHRKQTLLSPDNHPAAPIAMRRLAQAMESRTGVRRWLRLSHDTLDALEQEGFDFKSPAARDILTRSIRPREPVDEAAVLRLLALGASAETTASPDDATALEVALRERHSQLVAPLIDAGALLTDGRPDQAKIDAAFRAAIAGGRLAPAQQIWRMAGDQPHPSLNYLPQDSNGDRSKRRSPVVLLLDQAFRDDDWEGVEIARWLESVGTDLSPGSEAARGLMHIAADSDDPRLMQFLLAKDIDPYVVPQSKLRDFGIQHGEDMALALLGAQAQHRPGGWVLPLHYRRVATQYDWPRVIAWLDAHPEVTERKRGANCPPGPQVAEHSAQTSEAAGSCSREASNSASKAPRQVN